MRRYYFDLRDDNGLSLDEEGLECRNLQEVQSEAARALADMARDAVHLAAAPAPLQSLAIEVRDKDGQVLQVRFKFEIVTTKR